MANTFYHKLASGEWMNISNPGGPVLFKLLFDADDNLWHPQFTWDLSNYETLPGGNASQAAAQSSLDTFVGNINAGTVGP